MSQVISFEETDPEIIRINRISELRTLLTSSDYKVLPDYDKDNTEVIQQRQKWRAEIRQLLGE